MNKKETIDRYISYLKGNKHYDWPDYDILSQALKYEVNYSSDHYIENRIRKTVNPWYDCSIECGITDQEEIIYNLHCTINELMMFNDIFRNTVIDYSIKWRFKGRK